MPKQPNAPTESDVLAAYQAVNQHWSHAEQERWSILYNFLTANTILLLAWAAIFSSTTPIRGSALMVLSLSGILISLLWLTIGSRVNMFIKRYGELGETIENQLHLHAIGPFHVGEIIRKKERSDESKRNRKLNLTERLGTIIPSRTFVLFVPMLFVIIYIALLVLSLLPTSPAS
jgi:hypothetical protein